MGLHDNQSEPFVFSLNLAHFTQQKNAAVRNFPRFLLSDKSVVHAIVTMFVRNSAATKHLLANMLKIVLVLIGLLGDSSLLWN